MSFRATLLDGQFDTLEEPTNAVVVDATAAPDMVAAEVERQLGFTAAR